MLREEIFWNDLNEEAQKRLRAFWHENIDNNPLAIVELDDEEIELEYCRRVCSAQIKDKI